MKRLRMVGTKSLKAMSKIAEGIKKLSLKDWLIICAFFGFTSFNQCVEFVAQPIESYMELKATVDTVKEVEERLVEHDSLMVIKTEQFTQEIIQINEKIDSCNAAYGIPFKQVEYRTNYMWTHWYDH